jgi:hypothetical protein
MIAVVTQCAVHSSDDIVHSSDETVVKRQQLQGCDTTVTQ